VLPQVNRGRAMAMQMCTRVSVYGLSLAESRWTTEMKAAGTTYHYFKHWVDSEQLRAHPHHRCTPTYTYHARMRAQPTLSRRSPLSRRVTA